jgi:hypothetical protein
MGAGTDEFAGFAAAPASTATAAPADEFSGFAPAPASAVAAPPETAGRVAGLTGRALATGTASVPSAVLALENPIGTAMKVAQPIGHWIRQKLGEPDNILTAPPPASTAPAREPRLSDFIDPDKWSDAVDYLADKAGIAKPQTPGERIYSKAVQALPSAALAPEAPVMGAVSAAAGGAASQTVAENGGSPLQQTLAGLAVGSVPALASGAAQGARALIRNQADTAGRIADAAASGTQLTAGQATGSKLLQTVENSSSKMWGGGPIHAAADAQVEDLGNNVDRIVSNLAPGADVSPTGAGTAINAGGAATKASMRAAEQAAYDKVDALVPPQAPVDVSGTLAKLNELATPTPGAENTTAALVSPKITAMRDNLQADIAANGGSTTVPYSAATALKTKLGSSIDWGFAPSDPVANGALKQVHGALKGDIDAGASAVSPEAQQAVKNASALYVKNQDTREFLNGIIDKAGGPEAVYTAATNGTKEGATKISGVMRALNPDQQNLVRATVIDRLGKALPSQQNAAGDAFNASTFLTNWNKLAPEAKDALFGASGPTNQLRRGLDSFANTTATIRSSKIFPNPSGTGEAVGHGFGLMALLEGGGMALAGHPGHLAAVGGAIAANHVLARALTNPRTVAWLAASAKLPTSALPNAVNQLAKMGKVDPDARALAAAMQGQTGAAQ